MAQAQLKPAFAVRSARAVVAAPCKGHVYFSMRRTHPRAGTRNRLVCRATSEEGSASSGSDDAPSSSSGSSSSSVPDTLPLASGTSDWRAFRAALLAAEQGEKAAAAETQQSGWAHILPRAEQGCLLLAHPLFFHQNQTYFRDAVILLFAHSSSGSAGIILNRPSNVKMADIQADASAGLPGELASNTLYVGGDVGESTLHLLHGTSGLTSSVEVVPGVHLGGWEGAQALVAAGQKQPSEFKILFRYAGWGPGQLDEEVARGVWYPAAASADIILSPIAAAGAEHWHLVMQLMGGDHAGLSKALKADESGYDPEIMGLADESRRKREAAEEARRQQEGSGGEEPSGGAGI